MSLLKYPSNVWTVGEYEFREFTKHPFDSIDGPVYTFTIGGQKRRYDEAYESLDEALVAAVGEKYTGPRGAGGSGTDTAAGWFLRAIGARPNTNPTD